MILQALCNYYKRMANDPDGEIAPLGWEKKDLPFLITITRNADFVKIADTREAEGKKLLAKNFLLPASVKRARGILANLLWDNVEYCLGIPCGKNIDSPEKHEEIIKRHTAFIDKMKNYKCETTEIILKFLNNETELEKLKNDPLMTEFLNSNPFISFQFADSINPVFREADFVELFEQSDNSNEEKRLCLISGKQAVPARLHNAIKGVAGAQSTGGNIVSFNIDAARSFGKTQGMNAPVGEKAMFEYTTALNALLSKDSKQKFKLGDATCIFWAAENNEFEDNFAAFFQEPAKDNPNQLTNAVAQLYRSISDGNKTIDESDNNFYVLALAPNAARLSIRFWYVGTIRSMAENINKYFEDLRIDYGPKDQEHLSLWRLLAATAALGKSENINPLLAAELMRAALTGQPFPYSILQMSLLRCKAEQSVLYPRAKLIKACLNRQTNKKRKLEMSLNKENENIGYRLGRLFAVLEKIQQEALGKGTIRERFYASASSAPVTVFANLMRLKNYHLEKLSEGRKINMERLIGEILFHSTEKNGIQNFPAHLNLDNQGRFAIGYYHQMQDFYTKKDIDEQEQQPVQK